MAICGCASLIYDCLYIKKINSMSKIPVTASKIKAKICNTCGMQKTCGDLRGFCLLVNYIPIVLVIGVLVFLMVTMPL